LRPGSLGRSRKKGAIVDDILSDAGLDKIFRSARTDKACRQF
jgi:hypothetical protein